MTVRADKLPPIVTVLGELDREARKSARQAADIGVAAVRRTIPARSGRARSGQRGTVKRAPNGWTITIAPTSKVRYPNGVSAREVTLWLEKGTGVFGPSGRPIKPRRGGFFKLPQGYVQGEIRGQPAQHVYSRAMHSADAAAARILAAGAVNAARAMERALDRGRV